MEIPKCRTCGERHWGLCPTAKLSVAAKTTRLMQRQEPVRMKKQARARLKPAPDCPVCAARREKNRLAVARHRLTKQQVPDAKRSDGY